MKPNGKPGRVAPRTGPRHPENSNAQPYSGDRSESLAVDFPLIWTATKIEIPGATGESVFNLIPHPSAHEPELCAWVTRQLEGKSLPAPDHIVVLRQKAGHTIESDCMRIAQQMEASVVMCDLTNKRIAWAFPTMK